MSRYKDFDNFFAEVEDKPQVSIRLFGKLYYLPIKVPATIVIKSYRAIKAGKDTVSNEDELVLMVETLGVDNVDEWVSLGMTSKQMRDVYRWVIGAADIPDDGVAPETVAEEIKK